MSHPGLHDVPCPRPAMGRCCLAVERLESLGHLARLWTPVDPFLAFTSKTERKVTLSLGIWSYPWLILRIQGTRSNPDIDPAHCGVWLHLRWTCHDGNQRPDCLPTILLPGDKGCIASYFGAVHPCTGYTELPGHGGMWSSNDHDKAIHPLSDGWRHGTGTRLRTHINSKRRQ